MADKSLRPPVSTDRVSDQRRKTASLPRRPLPSLGQRTTCLLHPNSARARARGASQGNVRDMSTKPSRGLPRGGLPAKIYTIHPLREGTSKTARGAQDGAITTP